MEPIPPLPLDWEPTRATLHAYSQALGVAARAHIPPHPNWWHISLVPDEAGLVTDPIPLPDGGDAVLRLDLVRGDALVEVADDEVAVLPLDGGLSGREFGEAIFTHLSELGLPDAYERERITDAAGRYEPAHGSAFGATLRPVGAVFTHHRATLPGEPGPIQLWPHGFDLAFEWFGTRRVAGDEGSESPAQLNLGWYPAGDPYFYSSPWPFDSALLGRDLPDGAVWNTDGWEGAMLPFTEVAGVADGPDRLLEFARAVFDLARPTLTA